MNDALVADTSRIRKKTLLCAAIGCVAVLRIAAVFSIPFGQKVEHHLEGLNDEPAHVNYVKYLVRHRAFPVLEHCVLEPDAFVRNEFEYHQAPLYYLLCTPLYRFLDEKKALAACRLLSALFGIASLWIIATVLRDCRCPAGVQLAAVLFIGLLPSHLYFTSLVSNDALSWLFALLLTRCLLRYGTMPEAPSAAVTKTAAVTAVYLAAGTMVKSSLLIFFPVAAGVFLYKYFISKNRAHCARGVFALGFSGIAVVPWHVRNIVLYHSLLGTPPAPGHDFFTLQGIVGFLKETDRYFWFPMQHLHGGTPAFFVLCSVGAAILTAHLLMTIFYFVKYRRRDFPVILLLLLLLLNGAAYVWYAFFTQWGNHEARFLFPALASIAFFMIVPAYQFFNRLKAQRFFVPYILVIALFPYPFLLFAG
jgi:hypothetical protein